MRTLEDVSLSLRICIQTTPNAVPRLQLCSLWCSCLPCLNKVNTTLNFPYFYINEHSLVLISSPVNKTSLWFVIWCARIRSIPVLSTLQSRWSTYEFLIDTPTMTALHPSFAHCYMRRSLTIINPQVTRPYLGKPAKNLCRTSTKNKPTLASRGRYRPRQWWLWFFKFWCLLPCSL